MTQNHVKAPSADFHHARASFMARYTDMSSRIGRNRMTLYAASCVPNARSTDRRNLSRFRLGRVSTWARTRAIISTSSALGEGRGWDDSVRSWDIPKRCRVKLNNCWKIPATVEFAAVQRRDAA